MSRRISSVIFIIALIVITSSLFYFYIDYSRKVEQIPLKYGALQQEYEVEKSRVLEINEKIYSDLVREYELLGGDTSILSWVDKRRFLLSMDAESDFLGSIEHEPLATIQIPEPPSGESRISAENEDGFNLRSGFNVIIVTHAYTALMALAVYIVMMLLFKKKIVAKDS